MAIDKININKCITVKKFLARCHYLYLAISLIQVNYLIFIAKPKPEDYFFFLIIFTVSNIIFLIIRKTFKSSAKWPKINQKLFLFLFLFSAIFVIIFSRYDYILQFINGGMLAARSGEVAGKGGLYSAVTILFYPLCIILAFANTTKKYPYLLIMYAVILIDTIILGTRGVPILVVMFHILMWNTNFIRFRNISYIIILTFLLVTLFDYQSQSRSLDTMTVGYDWGTTLRHSWVTDYLEIDEDKIIFLEKNANPAMPAVFLIQYVTHSISVFSYNAIANNFDPFGTGYYLQDQICLVVRCDRDITSYLIESINPTAGLYQTMYGSLIFDFGWIGLFIIVITILLYVNAYIKIRVVPPLIIYLSFALTFSNIENYFYTGFTLPRVIIFIILVKILSYKYISHKSRKDL